jgi:hypothetical protein
MTQVMELNGALVNNEVINTLKEIQESPQSYLEVIENQMNLLITQRANIQESSDVMMHYLEELNFIKTALIRLVVPKSE